MHRLTLTQTHPVSWTARQRDIIERQFRRMRNDGSIRVG
jgi:hypothetical protein